MHRRSRSCAWRCAPAVVAIRRCDPSLRSVVAIHRASRSRRAVEANRRSEPSRWEIVGAAARPRLLSLMHGRITLGTRDYARVVQPADRARIEPQHLAQHLIRVLTEEGAAAVVPRGAPVARTGVPAARCAPTPGVSRRSNTGLLAPTLGSLAIRSRTPPYTPIILFFSTLFVGDQIAYAAIHAPADAILVELFPISCSGRAANHGSKSAAIASRAS